jgi:hypothetical protein
MYVGGAGQDDLRGEPDPRGHGRGRHADARRGRRRLLLLGPRGRRRMPGRLRAPLRRRAAARRRVQQRHLQVQVVAHPRHPLRQCSFFRLLFFFPFQVQLQSKVGCLIYNPTKCRISKMSNKKALLVLRSTHQFHARQKPFFFSGLGR